MLVNWARFLWLGVSQDLFSLIRHLAGHLRSALALLRRSGYFGDGAVVDGLVVAREWHGGKEIVSVDFGVWKIAVCRIGHFHWIVRGGHINRCGWKKSTWSITSGQLWRPYLSGRHAFRSQFYRTFEVDRRFARILGLFGIGRARRGITL